MAAPVVLVDVNGLGFAAQQPKRRLFSGEIETTAVFGVLRSLRLIREQFSGQVIVLWDGRSWRYDAVEEYKGDREANVELSEIREAWRTQRPLVARMLTTLGVHQVVAGNLEADDLAARLRRHYRDHGHEVVLVTGDKDWLQLLEEGVIAWDPVRERLTTMTTFSTNEGLPTPFSLAEYKSLQGDRSDNIKGVGGIGPKTASALLNTYGSVRGFINSMLADPDERARADRRAVLLMDPEKQDAFERNMRLIWLDHPKAPAAEKIKMIKGDFDEAAFQAFCEDFAFHSVLRDLPVWINVFSRKDN